jgi:hypothetical protein
MTSSYNADQSATISATHLPIIDTLLSDKQRSMSQDYGVQCTIDDTVMVPSKEIFK